MSDAGSSAAAAVSSPSAATASQPSQSPTSGAAAPAAQAKLPKPNGPAAVELEVYLQLLALSMLEAQQKWTELGEGATKLLQYLSEFNRRTLDFFQARAWSLVALAYERQGGGPAGLVPMRPSLITAHRTACLRHDEYGQSVLINILLRSYVETKEIDSAASLLSKASFPESASNAQLVRKLYYEGRVKAVQLQYSESHAALMQVRGAHGARSTLNDLLMIHCRRMHGRVARNLPSLPVHCLLVFRQALRKSPPSAVGFQTIVQKFAIVVQMLMGDLPERSLFSTPGMKAALKPYLELTRSVRAGDVKAFGAVVASDAAVFERDGTDTLVRRLEANVIKTGLRRIATSYSKISFKDIAAKLSLSSAEDAEFLAAKAIRDGVIDGSLDHEAGTLEARGAPNVYGTKEPQEAFHRRIAFTLDVHDASVRAMRYPAQALRADLESAEAARERLREEAEFVNALDEGKDMDDDDEEM